MKVIRLRAFFQKGDNPKPIRMDAVLGNGWILDPIVDMIDYDFRQITDWERCTGKKDKYGKVVYEGDLLKGLFYDNIFYGPVEGTFTVKWSEWDAYFILHDKEKEVIFNFLQVSINGLEKIGNIHVIAED